jgi:ABC-2 type transport system ATP-binding protein
VGLLGLNGAGKTTTMRVLTTFLPATSGTARLAGFDVRTQSLEVRKNIGYLPENVPLYSEMRVEEYLDYRAKLKGLNRKVRQTRIDFCLLRCRIREVRRRLVGTLSKGYRQRVGLADAMVADPPILILDEPTTGLDPVQIRETLALIKELGESRTIFLSTHILPEIEEVCGRIMIIHRGLLSSDKKVNELDLTEAISVEIHGPLEQVTSVLRTTEGWSGCVLMRRATIWWLARCAPGRERTCARPSLSGLPAMAGPFAASINAAKKWKNTSWM